MGGRARVLHLLCRYHWMGVRGLAHAYYALFGLLMDGPLLSVRAGVSDAYSLVRPTS